MCVSRCKHISFDIFTILRYNVAMITNIINNRILIANNNEVLPVYYQGELANQKQMIAHQLYKRALKLAHKIDDAIVSTWQTS
jgi:hypothetical protein